MWDWLAPFRRGGPSASYRRQCRVNSSGERCRNGQCSGWGGSISDSQKRHVLSPRLRKAFAEFSSWEALRPIRRRFEEKAWEPSPLNG